MAKLNPAKMVLATKVLPQASRVEESVKIPVIDSPKEVKGDGFRADFARFAEQGFIGQQQGDDDEKKK